MFVRPCRFIKFAYDNFEGDKYYNNENKKPYYLLLYCVVTFCF